MALRKLGPPIRLPVSISSLFKRFLSGRLSKSRLLILICPLAILVSYFASSLIRGVSTLDDALTYAFGRTTGLIELFAVISNINPSLEFLFNYIFSTDRSEYLNAIFSINLDNFVGDGDFASRAVGLYPTPMTAGFLPGLLFLLPTAFLISYSTYCLFRVLSSTRLVFAISTTIYLTYLIWEFPPDRIPAVFIVSFSFIQLSCVNLKSREVH